MERHQVRYMLGTFRNATVAEAFLLSVSEVSLWRSRLGLVPQRRGRGRANGAAPTTRYFG